MAASILQQEFNESQSLIQADYESCVFRQCDFSEMDLSGFRFIQCEFIRCQLSLSKTHKTMFDHALFRECKLVGIRFDECNAFSFQVQFVQSIISHCSFHHVRMPKTKFDRCSLLEVDFTTTDLRESSFDSCQIQRCTFEQTNLEKVDFSTADGFSIDPSNNRIKQAIFSRQGLLGLVDHHNIRVVE